MKRLSFACDLKHDAALIKEYRKFHEPGNVWPEIISSIKTAGIQDMEIYLQGSRLFMIMEVDDDFDPERKIQLDRENPKVVEWEEFMWRFQQAVPDVPEDQKWTPMERIFKLP